MRTHTFTTDAPTFPLHAVDIEVPRHFDLASIDFDALAEGWNGPDVEAAYAAKDAFFAATTEAKRDQDKAAEWGCTVEELPWNARKAPQ